MKNKRFFTGMLALALVFGLVLAGCDTGGGGGGPTPGPGPGDIRPTTPEAMSGKTAMQYFTDEGIKVGINMGNTLDAVDTWTNPSKPISVETAWGNPKANQAYFTGLKNLGFNIVRIPVTWNGHIGSAPNYKIEEAYLKRVAEVVGYAKTAGLKAFINVHHDGNHNGTGQNMGGWLDIRNAASDPAITAKFEAVWKQIAEYFINYGDWLMFQGFNEIQRGDWQENGTQAEYNIINDWNQKFTDAVRSTGGNNAQRYLLYYGYMTSSGIADSALFKLPTDTATGRQIVGFHFYYPWSFAGVATDANWSTEAADKAHINSTFGKMKTKFVDNNIPVIIGENGPFGYVNHAANPGYSAANAATAKEKRLAYIDYMYGKARENRIVPHFWENGRVDLTYTEGDACLINRSNGQANSAESAEVIQHMINATR
jgi:endoglucanase